MPLAEWAFKRSPARAKRWNNASAEREHLFSDIENAPCAEPTKIENLILEIMPNPSRPGRKRGRPRSGKKQYCIRMLPETHDMLLQMGQWQRFRDQPMTNLLEQFAQAWTEKLEFLKSKGVTLDGPQGSLMMYTFDAQKALHDLISWIQADPSVTSHTAKTVLSETKIECERFIHVLGSLASHRTVQRQTSGP